MLELVAIVDTADKLEAFFARYEHIAWAVISSVSFVAALFAIRYRYKHLFESEVNKSAEVKLKEYRQKQQGFMFDIQEARQDKMLDLYKSTQDEIRELRDDIALLKENYAANNGRRINQEQP